MSDARSATIIRVVKNRDNPYVVIHQGVFLDPRLSWKAKGLLGYFLSRPDDWTIQVRDLVRRSRDGRDSVYAGLAELKAAGYVEQRVLRQPNGRIAQVEYVVYEQPQDAPAAPDSDTPAPALTPVPAATSGFSGTGKAGSGKAGRLLNNDLTKYGGDNNNSAADPAHADDSTPSGRLSPTAVVVSPGTVSEPARPGGAAPQPEQGERVRPVQRPLLLPDADARTLANRLHDLGIPGRLAHRWVAQDRAQCVQVLAWLDVCPPAEQPTNPAGWVRRAIEEHWAQAAEAERARRREADIAAARAWWAQLDPKNQQHLWDTLLPSLAAQGLPAITVEALARSRGTDRTHPGIAWLLAARQATR